MFAHQNDLFTDNSGILKFFPLGTEKVQKKKIESRLLGSVDFSDSTVIKIVKFTTRTSYRLSDARLAHRFDCFTLGNHLCVDKRSALNRLLTGFRSSPVNTLAKQARLSLLAK